MRREEKRKEIKRKKKLNREIAVVTYIFFALFLVLIGYMTNFLMKDKSELLNNPYNKRQELLAKQIKKGSILSKNGKELARTETIPGGKEIRTYPYGKMFAHVVGRSQNGKTGLESTESYTMLTTNINPIYGALNQMKGEKNPGNNIVTTLDEKLQKIAYDAMAGVKGAVIAMDPETGDILAMVSLPAYDPNTVAQDWDVLTAADNQNSALYNRATQGLYPPGSTFKLTVALEFMRENEKFNKFSYQCQGKIGEGTDVIRCYGGTVHGALDLKTAFAKSCNATFGYIGSTLDRSKWKKLCESLYFGETIPIELEQKKSSFKMDNSMSEPDVRQTGIGQGATLVTPLQNILLTAAVANDGVIMKPHLVDRIEDAFGNTVKKIEPKAMASPITRDEAKALYKLMRQTVKQGTAVALSGSNYAAGGKTGSAEFKMGSDESHSWFIGFAEKNKKKIVVSIIGEGAGTGSQFAVPIAKKIFDAY